ncbi:hydroxycinnamoyltransferase-like isoform X2 [Cryptomeria japonica]|uniref:hydroxycinnamoyltransferase-like isoform X2 n=1 Tax=Cryptomeria japonica TaxID=3369 RepID=UPI0027DAA5C4|nr:hydroxycinnamoyltransferase-like isoform X2 [Cryptomeria japonica]
MAEQVAETVVVNVRSTFMVKPAIPPPTQAMFLSGLDLFWIRVENVQTLFFYKLSPTMEYTSLIQDLKKSLSSILVYFYPLTGWLKNGELGRTEVDFTDGGVEFKVASASVQFEDLEKDGFRSRPFFQSLARNVDDTVDESYRRPLLSIQVTEFAGSGMCIGTSLHHVIGDGNSFFHFMKSWAEFSRGLPIAKPPQHDRTVFKRERKNSPSLSYKAHQIVNDGIRGANIFKFVPDDSKSEHKITSSIEKEGKSEEVLQKRTDLIQSTFCFTEEIIQELKMRSRAKTSFVAVAAQFWRCVMRAREVPQEEGVFFAVLADCRGRVKPPLLPTYFGNCVSLGVAQTRADTLINADISFAADVIQQLISSCTEEAHINHMIDWVESCNKDLLKEAGWKYGTRVVASPRFPLYDIDYGWGKPADVQLADLYDIGSMVLSAPKDGTKSIMVSTCLPQHQMDILHHFLFSEKVLFPSALLIRKII